MPKTSAEDKLKEKLEYINLNLTRIPKFLKEFKPFQFRPSKTYDENSYKVYKYIPISKIQIFLTPTDRLADLKKKYQLAVPISEYLDSKTEENAEKFASFKHMLEQTNIEDIKEIEKEQERLQETIPYEVKYKNNYIWQIYYSDLSDMYFMLVSTNEINNLALFYILKHQIQISKSKKEEYVYAPISHLEYSGRYLVKSQITDIENYLWYFTKEWPDVFEVQPLVLQKQSKVKDNTTSEMSLKIVGKTKIYDSLESDYVITLNSKEEALQFYKLLKALFILATAMPEDYNFKTQINKNGEIDLVYEDKEGNLVRIQYDVLSIFIKTQVKEKVKELEDERKKVDELIKNKKELQKLSEEQNDEYLSKQRQIATFLACKKSFFGKLKYYFGSSKRSKMVKPMPGSLAENGKIEKLQEENILNLVEHDNMQKNNGEADNEKLNLHNIGIKSYVFDQSKQYTIEDLIEICTKLENIRKQAKALRMDKKALELKNENLKRKIKNANIYINEIDMHKRSIFEFWKFSNKDELPSLNEGDEEEETKKEKISKSFDFDIDFEELGKKMDELQRRKFSKNETDAIFSVQYALKSLQILHETKSEQLTKAQIKQLEQELNKLKQEYKDNYETILVKDVDIFGSFSEDRTKTSYIKNTSHREIAKDKYKILSITPETELSVYIDNLRNYLNLIEEAFHKITSPIDISAYLITEEDLKTNNIYIFGINATNELYRIIKENNKKKIKFNMYKLNIKENMPILFYTNSTLYDNFNKTLPVGMDLSTQVIVDLSKYKLEEEQPKQFFINYIENEYEHKVIDIKMTVIGVS